MFDSDTILWTALAVWGGASAAFGFSRVRLHLTTLPAHGRAQEAWRRARVSLTTFALGLLMCGVGVGGILGVAYTPQFSFGEVEVEPVALPRYSASTRDWVSPTEPSEGDEPSGATRDSAGPEDPAPASPEAPDPGPGPEEGEEETRAFPLAFVDVAEAATVAEPSDGTPPVFGVRIGVFGNPDNANNSVRLLREGGYSPLAVRRTGASGNHLYFVYAGTYASRDEAQQVARDLRERGGEPVVIEIVVPGPES
jgi:cell division septation protein DedD